MKKLVHIIALISISYLAIAQTKKLKEGVAEFDISYPSLSGEMKQMESSLPKNMTIYFKNDLSRIDMNSSMGSTYIISDFVKKELIVLMDMLNQKFAIKQSQDEISKNETELRKNGKMPEFKIVESKETKIIAGYKCKKAIVQYTLNGKQEQMICFYTEYLPQINTGTDNMALKEIKGFLMEYNINQNGIEMRIVANNINAQIVDDKLFLIPDDYKIITQEEISGMMKAGAKSNNGK